MATLPQAADYGRRVQLRSNRVDAPGSGEMAVATSLERAAAAFTGLAIEHKQKDDALSYANAKNEYLIADIQEREKLKHDEDFGTHDERYRQAMKGHYERLFPTVNSNRDRVLFDAEARLMNERGSVAVKDNSRTMGIDHSIEAFNSHQQDAKAIILTANDAQTAQDAMFGVLEEATALRDKGYLTNDQYKAVLQTWVQDTAFARLRAMDPADREVLLERSITHQKTTGKPVTEEDIKAGLGSGSIADFLSLDTAVAMYEQTQKANEIQATLGEAQAIFDVAQQVHPTDTGALMESIREATKDADPEVREKALVLGRQYRDEKRNELLDDRDRIVTAGSAGIEQGISPDSMNPDDLALLTPQQKAVLDAEWAAHLEGSQHGKANVWTRQQAEEANLTKSYADWAALSDEEKVKEDLQSAEWRMSFTPKMHKDLVDEQDNLNSGAPSTRQLPGGLTNQQMVTSALSRQGIVPQLGRDLEETQAFQQVIFIMDRRTQEAQEAKGAALTNTERNKILAEIMAPIAFTDTDFFMSDYDLDEAVPVAAMSVKQRETARLKLEDAQEDMVPNPDPDAIPVSYYNELLLMASKLQVSPSRHQIERAYFALKYGHMYGMDSDDVIARLKGE
jgi:hypothetical protein